MDESTIFYCILIPSVLVSFLLFRRLWEQKYIRAALRDWHQYDIQYGPTFVVCYSTLPPRKEPRHGFGVLAVAGENLLLRTQRGKTEIILVKDIRWIAAGNMWRRTIGGGKYGPHLIIQYENGDGNQMLAFHLAKNLTLSEYLSEHYQKHSVPIPRGFRIWNGRLITRPD